MKMQIADSLIKYLVGKDPEKVYGLALPLSEIYIFNSKYDDAERVLERFLIQKDIYQPGTEKWARLVDCLANVRLQAGNIVDAERCIDQVYSETEINVLSPDLQFSLNNKRLVIACKEGDKEKAKSIYQMIKDMSISDNELAQATTNYISLLNERQEFDEALHEYEGNEEKILNGLSGNEAAIATFYSNKAIALTNTSHPNEALKYDLKAKEIRERILDPYSKDMEITYIALAEDYVSFGNDEEVEHYIIKAEEIDNNAFESKDKVLLRYQIKNLRKSLNILREIKSRKNEHSI